MKIFFYKSILIFILFLLGAHYSFGLITKGLKHKYENFATKENMEKLKTKVRKELKNGSEKDVLLSPADAKLINKFLLKIKSELEKN
mgnify:CR=1 FL=1|jgi:hypothetical protein